MATSRRCGADERRLGVQFNEISSELIEIGTVYDREPVRSKYTMFAMFFSLRGPRGSPFFAFEIRPVPALFALHRIRELSRRSRNPTHLVG